MRRGLDYQIDQEEQQLIQQIIESNKEYQIIIQQLPAAGVALYSYQQIYQPNMKLIGSGAYGNVYKSYLENNFVALKVIKLQELINEAQSIIQDFFKEVQILTKARSSNILQLRGVCIEGGLIMVFEFHETNLKILMKQKKLTDQEKIEICIDIAKGVNVLHNLTPKVLHRDLKPANILINSKKMGIVADLGLACITFKSKRQPSSAAGTILYMPPEAFSQKPIGKGYDVWSFGCILNELFTQHIPWPGLKYEQIYNALKKGKHPKIAENINFELQLLIKNCFNYDQDLRPQFSQIILQLEQIIEQIKNKDPITYINQQFSQTDLFQDQISEKNCNHKKQINQEEQNEQKFQNQIKHIQPKQYPFPQHLSSSSKIWENKRKFT